MIDQEILTVREVAERLKVAEKTVYRLCDRGLLRRIPGLRVIRIPRSSLDKFIVSAEIEVGS